MDPLLKKIASNPSFARDSPPAAAAAGNGIGTPFVLSWIFKTFCGPFLLTANSFLGHAWAELSFKK